MILPCWLVVGWGEFLLANWPELEIWPFALVKFPNCLVFVSFLIVSKAEHVTFCGWTWQLGLVLYSFSFQSIHSSQIKHITFCPFTTSFASFSPPSLSPSCPSPLLFLLVTSWASLTLLSHVVLVSELSAFSPFHYVVEQRFLLLTKLLSTANGYFKQMCTTRSKANMEDAAKGKLQFWRKTCRWFWEASRIES